MTRSTVSIFGIIGGALLFAQGCLVGPDFKKPVAVVPENWGAKDDPRIATQTEVDATWWRAFGDPTLEELVQRAYRQNLPLQVAGLRIVEARAQLGISIGMQWPQVTEAFGSATAVGLSTSVPNASTLPNFVPRYGDYQVGFDAAWELDFWGKYRRGVRSDAAAALASMADYYSALVSLTAEVVRAYVAIRTSEALLAEAKDNVRVQEDALGVAKSRFQNGATSELDPAQAATILESTRATIPPLQATFAQGKNALCTLLGVHPGSLDGVLASGPKKVPSAPTRVAVGMPADMLRRRPDIRSAELRAAAQCERIGIAKADYYPSFSIAGVLGLETTSTSQGLAAITSGSIFYSVGPQVHWSFFSYGRITNNVRVQDAKFQELLVEYQNTVLTAVREVEDALSGFLNAQDAIAPSEKAVAAAQRAFELALSQYREGSADYQRVLDSERALLQQQQSLTQASSSIATNLVALYKALGGGWELEQGKTVVPEQTRHEMEKRTGWGSMLKQPIKH
jgi:NodT family efflux transporter outer membrane factor (OMF) lipoprotein